MKLDRIYTRGGDEGKTSLGDGTRLPKYHVRIEAYGSIDEANSVIGIAILHVEDAGVRDLLRHIQNDLFDVGADLCRPESTQTAGTQPRADLRINDRQVQWLEEQIDQLNASLSPLTSFVLPGGSSASAHLHLARTVVRRAERRVVELAEHELAGQMKINSAALKYINRLSDLLFVLARYLNDQGRQDITWNPGLHR